MNKNIVTTSPLVATKNILFPSCNLILPVNKEITLPLVLSCILQKFKCQTDHTSCLIDVYAMAMFMEVRQRKVYGDRKVVTRCKELMRFETESIDFLATEFLPNNDETRGKALSQRQRMEIFLRYISDPGFQTGVSEDFGVERSTVSKTINYVINHIIEKADNWIHFPNTIMEINNAKMLWQTRFELPTVIGALDCTHVEILKPSGFGDEYVNRKGYASINVQATCDASEKITSVSAEWPGSVHDARIWRRSQIRDIISRFEGAACLLGDSGYGISPWLITPFKPAVNIVQGRFNRQHASERVIIERVFGQLKRRFPILGNCIRLSLDKVPKVVVSCAVLHNVAKHLKDEYDIEPEQENIGEIDEYEEIIGDDVRESNVTKMRGEQKRQDMINQVL